MTNHSTAPSFSRGLAALACAVLASCTSLPSIGPAYRVPPFSLPTAWQSAPPAANDEQTTLRTWWQQLDDAELDRLIARTLAANHDLKQAEARLRQARAARSQAVGAFFPSLTASTGANRQRTADSTQTLYDAGFDATWEIDLFGGTRRGLEAADADTATVAAQLENTRISLLAEVAQNYVELRSYQQRLAIARDNLETQSETAQIAEWRLQAGLGGSSDVEQAISSREQTRASLPDLEIGLAAARNRLAVLSGEMPGTHAAALAQAAPLPDVPADLATGIPAQVLTRRPDLIAAERKLAAETARTGQKLAARFPSLTLNASFGWQAYSLAALGGSDTLLRALGGTLAATLFDGGRLRAAVDAQQAVQEEALAAYEGSVLTAIEEVENALFAHAAARDRLAARRLAASAARNAALLSRQLYESGLSDFRDVLDTERTRLSAEDNLALAEATQLSSLIKLYKALGGGWNNTGTEN